MLTQQVQVKLTLSPALKDFLESKARKFDMPIAGYVKHLILKDVEDMDFPVYPASDSTIAKSKKALKDHKQGKTIKIVDIEKYFKDL